MYERSAIVLEKHYNHIFGFEQKINLKTIYKNYKEIVKEIQKYQSILKTEDKIINEFDQVANEIRSIQQEQKKIYKSNIKHEEERNQLFDSLDEEPDVIEKRLKKIEENVEKNNKKLEELREDFVKALRDFTEKQKERNKYSRSKRNEEKEYLQVIEILNKNMNELNLNTVKNLKKFIGIEDDGLKNEIIEIMLNNGKDEKVGFDKMVIEKAVNIRNEIAKKEAECYIVVFERIKRLLQEINGDEIKLEKYKKSLRDISVKLSFLKAQKNYIVSFLDNERMTAIYGIDAHEQMMIEACGNFDLDMEQFNNLYELILKEISGKSSKKAYKELYNKEYLKNIEDKEKKFKRELSNIKINAGTIINSNYWRIEEIKNIYEVFQKEVTEKFERDLSEFKLEVIEEIKEEIEEIEPLEDEIFKTNVNDEEVEYIEEYEYDEDDDYEEEYDEYEDDDIDEEIENEEDNSDDTDNQIYEEFELDDDDDEDEYDSEEYDEYDDYEEEYEEDDYEYEYDEDDDDYYDEDDYSDSEEEADEDENQNGKGKNGLFNKFFKDKR